MSQNHLQQIGIRQKKSGGENELDYFREYRAGDNYKKINWKASAKSSFPIVQIDERENNRNIITMLDAGRMMTTRYSALTKLDYAIDTALLLGGAAISKKDYYGLVAFSQTVTNYIPPGQEKRVLNSILKSLYEIEPQFTTSDYLNTYHFLKKRIRKNSIIFLFSELYNRITSKELLQLLVLLSRLHTVHFISFEEHEQKATGHSLDKIARWYLQEEHVLEKQILLQELQKHGVKTLRVNESNIKQKVINAYLNG